MPTFKFYDEDELESSETEEWERDNLSAKAKRELANRNIRDLQARIKRERELEETYAEDYFEEYEEEFGESMQPFGYMLIGGFIIIGLSNMLFS